MEVLVIGHESEFEEIETKFGNHNELIFAEDHSVLKSDVTFDCVFDFLVGESSDNFDFYNNFTGLTIFINIPKISLQELMYFMEGQFSNTVFGFNGLPTFMNRPLLEVSVLHETDKDALAKICKGLSTYFELVNDRVGMVTPRIIFMIINEAFYTVQEGTATKEDIDLGMKLGTNYPFGPFEWCEKIGIENVYETLEAIYEDTKEERYKICPLLKTEYLRS